MNEFTGEVMQVKELMCPIYSKMAELLMDLECTLRNMNLWRSQRPSEEAFASDQPFCVDTMDFTDWLQFVFIEKMGVIIEDELPLPRNCGLAPMAEEVFRQAEHSPRTLIRQLEEIDETLSR